MKKIMKPAGYKKYNGKKCFFCPRNLAKEKEVLLIERDIAPLPLLGPSTMKNCICVKCAKAGGNFRIIEL